MDNGEYNQNEVAVVWIALWVISTPSRNVAFFGNMRPTNCAGASELSLQYRVVEPQTVPNHIQRLARNMRTTQTGLTAAHAE